jgi:hypothetical protein
VVSLLWWRRFTFVLFSMTAMKATAKYASPPVMTLVVDEGEILQPRKIEPQVVVGSKGNPQ